MLSLYSGSLTWSLRRRFRRTTDRALATLEKTTSPITILYYDLYRVADIIANTNTKCLLAGFQTMLLVFVSLVSRAPSISSAGELGP